MFAFIPLLIAQGLCAYTLIKKPDSTTWRETNSTLLFFAIAASISLISQIYNIMGEMESFVLTWMVLALPIVYVMRSSMVSIMYLIGITNYGMMAGFGINGFHYWYWLLLVALLPHYYRINQQEPNRGFTIAHHLFIPISLAIMTGTLLDNNDLWILPIYMSLFGVSYLIGHTSWIKQNRYNFNGYQLVGAVGMVILLLSLSFDAYWGELLDDFNNSLGLFNGSDWIIMFVLTLIGIGLLIQQYREDNLSIKQPMKFVFLLFPFIFLFGLANTVLPTLLINILTLLIGIYYIHWGTTDNSLTLTNYGLLIISLLIICRFFDTNISFVVRGLLFIAIGIGFFFANYRLIQRRKAA